MENSVAVPKKIKHRTTIPIIPFPDAYPKELKADSQRDIVCPHSQQHS